MKQKIQLDVIKNKKYYGNKPGIGTKIKSFKNDNFAIIFNNTKLDYRIHAWDNTNHVVTCYFNMNIKTKKPSVNLWLFFSSFHCSFILPERMQKIR